MNAVDSSVHHSYVAVEVALDCYEKEVQTVAGSDMIVGCHSLKGGGVLGSEGGNSIDCFGPAVDAFCVQYSNSQSDYPILWTVHHCKLGHCILGTVL